MTNNPIWKPGAVKLLDGSDAVIHYIQESDSTLRYIGMYHRSTGLSYAWWPIAWTAKGSVFPFTTEPYLNLVPPSRPDEKLNEAIELLTRIDFVMSGGNSVINDGVLHSDICKFLKECE